MRRSTFSLLLTAAILAAGAGLWLLAIAPHFGLPPYAPKTIAPDSSATSTPSTPEHARDSALNLYLAAPPEMPNEALRAELTLIAARLTDAAGKSVSAFDGTQRVMLQNGVAQQALSERIPAGRWTRLSLEFSPAVELVYANGRTQAALLGRNRMELGFDAEVGVSRSLAMFASIPLERSVVAAERAIVANIAAEPRTAETYVFGGFMLEPRDRGDILEISEPSLIAVIKEDLGFDLSVKKPGSSGFQPAHTDTPVITR